MIKNHKIIILVLCIIIIIATIIVLLTTANVENFDASVKNKITFPGWPGGEEEKQTFYDIFSDFTNKYDEIQIYSPGSLPSEKNPKVLLVNFSAEVYYNDCDKFDVNFVPDNKGKNVIPLPYSSYLLNNKLLYGDKFDMNKLCEKRRMLENQLQKKFCVFAVSNGACKARNNFFTELNKYKKVDSCGKLMNNVDEPCGGFWFSNEYMNYISKYKFMICFENSTQPNYFTEKLITAYYYGTIPIYWGCPNIDEYVNMSSILYLKPDFTKTDVDELIQEIIKLDNNEELYKAKYESTFFKNGTIPDAFDINKIKQKTKKILQIE